MYYIFSYSVDTVRLSNCKDLLVFNTETNDIEVVSVEIIREYIRYYDVDNTNLVYTSTGIVIGSDRNNLSLIAKNKFIYTRTSEKGYLWYRNKGYIADGLISGECSIVGEGFFYCVSQTIIECSFDNFVKKICLEAV